MAREIAYRVLASQLRAAIKAGTYGETLALPTEDQLSERYEVSRNTVRRAMQELVSEGLIYRVAGRGTFPVPNRTPYVRHFGSVEELMALSQETECELLEPLSRSVDVESASRLRLRSDDIMSLCLRRFHHGVPFCVTTVTLPPDVGEIVADIPELTIKGSRSRVTVIGLLDARGPRPITLAEQSVNATAIPQGVEAHLACKAGEPVLRVDRLYFDTGGQAVELAVSYFDPRHYSYRVSLHRDTE